VAFRLDLVKGEQHRKDAAVRDPTHPNAALFDGVDLEAPRPVAVEAALHLDPQAFLEIAPLSHAPPSCPVRPVKLTEWTSCGGCAAKWGGAPLASLLRDLGAAADPSLLVGLAPFDDAAVYRLGDGMALVSTTDFFPPLVDDPEDFGAIAAANACSDVFAMGGRVVLALNISAFPEEFPPSVIATILRSAAEVVGKAGGVVAGGHTIRSAEPIFGLAVQGLVDPDRVWTKRGARPGDRLVLSKPIGTGIVLAGDDEDAKRQAIAVMRRLNRAAAEQLAGRDVHAATDVTGFGIAGHAWEMADRSGVRVHLDTASLPLYAGALEAAEAGVRTGGDARNREYLQGHVDGSAPAAFEALVFDPQTSGGLLVALDPRTAGELVDDGWWPVGEVGEGPARVTLHYGSSR
jgi:selenide,water dikinase